MTENCTFCRIYEEGEAVVHEDEHFFIQFDAYPVTAGHLEIIPRRHIESVFQLSEEEWEQLQKTLKKAKQLIKESDLEDTYENLISNPLDQKCREFCQDVKEKENWSGSPDAYNIGINEGREAGRTIDHLHIHLIPRYQGDIDDPAGGIRRVIPGKKDYS